MGDGGPGQAHALGDFSHPPSVLSALQQGENDGLPGFVTDGGEGGGAPLEFFGQLLYNL